MNEERIESILFALRVQSNPIYIEAADEIQRARAAEKELEERIAELSDKLWQKCNLTLERLEKENIGLKKQLEDKYHKGWEKGREDCLGERKKLAEENAELREKVEELEEENQEQYEKIYNLVRHDDKNN